MKTLSSVFLFMLFFTGAAAAQTQITFNIDMRPFMADSSFIPGRDVVEVKGNFYPLDSRPLRLTDTSPKDSIFTAEVTFPSRYNNLTLQYNYELVLNGRRRTEDSPRGIVLNGRPTVLPPLHFNALAW